MTNDSARWQFATTSILGVGLGDLLSGLPINRSHDFTGNFFDLLTLYGLWTGVTLLGLCLLHGATFLKLKTTDALRARARVAAGPLGWAAIALVIGHVIWTRSVAGGADVPEPVQILAVIAVIFAARLAVSEEHDGWAFSGLGGGDRRDHRLDLHRPLSQRHGLEHQGGYNLTVNNSASASYALRVMTIVAVIFLPVVLLYQSWSFHVFRARVKAPAPSEAVDHTAGRGRKHVAG